MANFNFYLSNPKAVDNTYIVIRFTHLYKVMNISTGLKILPKHWNFEKHEVRKTKSGYSAINERLKEIQKLLQAAYDSSANKALSWEQLKTRFQEVLGRSLNSLSATDFEHVTAFAEHYNQTVSVQKKGTTLRTRTRTVELLKEFESTVCRRRLTFDDIDIEFYNAFTVFLSEQGYRKNTVAKHIRILKHFLNEATERGINKNLAYKSSRFKAESEDVETVYLTNDEIEHLRTLDLTDNPRLENARDLFLFGCYTGLRFSDFNKLRPEHILGDTIAVKTEKTNELVQIPIHPKLQALMSDYVARTGHPFPRSISNQKLNDFLKEIGQLAGWDAPVIFTSTIAGNRTVITRPKYECITTHTARRSFATNLYLQTSDTYLVMQFTGHKTEKAFRRYIRVTTPQYMQRVLDVWNNPS